MAILSVSFPCVIFSINLDDFCICWFHIKRTLECFCVFIVLYAFCACWGLVNLFSDHCSAFSLLLVVLLYNFFRSLVTLGNKFWLEGLLANSINNLLLEVFVGWKLGKKASILWSCVVRVLLWHIWIERNHRMFEDKSSSFDFFL